ncbi:MAG TPA: cytochrome c peroxidase [Polyangiaceae bacterium]|nr:cytochrome c peroxidase [Polyangiaceae bacterium]
MSREPSSRSWAALAVLLLGVACKEQEPVRHRATPVQASSAPPGVEVDSAKVDLYGALPDKAPSKASPEAIALGQELYFDARLSRGQDVSCNGCHDLSRFGTDGKDFSLGTLGAKETRNTPALYDAAFATTQFWDGRAETLEDAVKAMVLSPVTGAGGEKEVTTLVSSIPGYVDAFKKAFPDDPNPVSSGNAVNALAAFVRTLVVPSRWDQFAKGTRTALTDDEKKGFLEFVAVGCPTCHLGPLFGGTMFQKLGKERPWPNQKDPGRSAVTKSASDEMMFRVAPLRNLEHTAPYFHDASGKTLEDAVKTMAAHQLGKDLSDAEVKSIAVFLRTLGPPSVEAPKAPTLPPSGPKTPKPAKH